MTAMLSNTPITRENFLQPEIRCDFEVTAKTKRIWKVQLDMLELFMKICEKHHLRWQVNGGTLLGAVRHHGYIPWDDDVDVIMPRADYDKFNQVAQKELPSHIAVENALVNPAELGIQTRLRNSNTTQIDPWRLKRHDSTNMGIFIDIVPTDEVPANFDQMIPLLETFLKQSRHIAHYRTLYQGNFIDIIKRLWHNRKQQYYFKDFIKGGIQLLKNGGGRAWFEKNEDMIRNYNFATDEKRLCGLAKWAVLTGRYAKVFWPTEELWGELIDIPFEYLTVKAPKAYDHLLTINYGDWHKLVKGESGHKTLEIDPDRPYKEILMEKYGFTGKEFRQ